MSGAAAKKHQNPRVICLSCNTQRTSNTAVHWVDRFIAPDVTGPHAALGTLERRAIG
jgi:hypothetical protein